MRLFLTAPIDMFFDGDAPVMLWLRKLLYVNLVEIHCIGHEHEEWKCAACSDVCGLKWMQDTRRAPVPGDKCVRPLAGSRLLWGAWSCFPQLRIH